MNKTLYLPSKSSSSRTTCSAVQLVHGDKRQVGVSTRPAHHTAHSGVRPNLLWAGLSDLVGTKIECPVKFAFQKDSKSFFSISIAHAVFALYLSKALPGSPIAEEEGKGRLFTYTRCWAFGGLGKCGCMHPDDYFFLSRPRRSSIFFSFIQKLTGVPVTIQWGRKMWKHDLCS